MAEPIVVKVTDERGTTTTQVGNVSNTQASNTALNPQAKNNKQKSKAAVVAKMIALRSVNYATSNVGKRTGNSNNQAIVNNIKQGIGYAVAFSIDPVLGAISVGLDTATYALDYAYERKWEQIRVQQAQVKYGGKGGYRR
jgi:hypothetical protein